MLDLYKFEEMRNSNPSIAVRAERSQKFCTDGA